MLPSRFIRGMVKIGRTFVRRIRRRILVRIGGRWRLVKRFGKSLRVRYRKRNRKLRIGRGVTVWLRRRWRSVSYRKRGRRRRLKRRLIRKRRRYRRKLRRRRRRQRRRRRRRRKRLRRRRRCVMRFRFRRRWRRVYRRNKRLAFRYGRKYKYLR